MTDEPLLHYSGRPLGSIQTFPQRPDAKPCGLWVSVGEAWKEFCVSERSNLRGLTVVHQIALRSTAKILRIKGRFGLQSFTDAFGINDGHRTSCPGIDWPRVAAQWAGIIIAPYCYSCRRDDYTSWYYGWDIASGCIWDPAAIESVTVLSEANEVAT